ncbi:MAG: hypothetical protein MR324_03770 [Lachnospiraceae bacterium]|nr:hypothetical protein [Lachnospiraceae bacterium]
MKENPTEEEKQKDRENCEKAYQSNMTKSYIFKNKGLDIKINSMEILYKRLKELDVIADSQSGDEKLGTLAIMAEIGKSIIPD